MPELKHAIVQALSSQHNSALSSVSTQVGGNIGIETKRLRALYPDTHIQVFEKSALIEP